MRSIWSAAAMSVPGNGDHLEPGRRSDPIEPAVGGGAPAGDFQSQRPPFVREAQRALRDLGYQQGPIDGTFGPQTRTTNEKTQLATNSQDTTQLELLPVERLVECKLLFRTLSLSMYVR